MNEKTIIIGGGIAGLLTAIQLQTQDIPCLVIEKKRYPFHRVCGEYISNEAKPFLKKLDLFPTSVVPTEISRFQLSSVRGKSTTMPLDLGGFGVSRFAFDNFLYERAVACGVEFLFEEVNSITFEDHQFTVISTTHKVYSKIVVAASGKRSLLDMKLERSFIQKRSPFVGVKYHIRTDHDADLIALHNFDGGYCGISNVENGVTNLCYLASAKKLKESGDIKTLEQNVLYTNPLLKSIFMNADFLFHKPEVIGEISFETKSPVEGHIIMVGDAAGMITPLCGNGMAMAIHSSKIAVGWISAFWHSAIDRATMENSYSREWNHNFKARLRTGRQVQQLLFGTPFASEMAAGLISNIRPLRNFIMRQTHGVPF